MLTILKIDLWAGLGSTIVGGLLAAMTVVLGVVLAQRNADRRAMSAARRKAGDDLIVEVSNLRDMATRSQRKARSGHYDLWPLRTRLYITQTALRGLSAYEETWNFYWAVRDARTIASTNDLDPDDPRALNGEEWEAFEKYIRDLDAYGDRLIKMLQECLEDPDAKIEGRPHPLTHRD